MNPDPSSSIFDELVKEHYAEPAGIGQRFANFLVDSVVCWLFNICILMAMGIGFALNGKTEEEIVYLFSDNYLSSFIALFNYIVLYTFMEGASKGRTPGKLITGTVAVREDLTKITWSDAFIRTICRIIPFEPVSMFADHPWHDRWSKTTVVKKKSLEL